MTYELLLFFCLSSSSCAFNLHTDWITNTMKHPKFMSSSSSFFFSFHLHDRGSEAGCCNVTHVYELLIYFSVLLYHYKIVNFFSVCRGFQLPLCESVVCIQMSVSNINQENVPFPVADVTDLKASRSAVTMQRKFNTALIFTASYKDKVKKKKCSFLR